jgi:hypothetical protein
VDVVAHHTVAPDLKGEYVVAISKTGFDGYVFFVFNRLDGKSSGDPANKGDSSRRTVDKSSGRFLNVIRLLTGELLKQFSRL